MDDAVKCSVCGRLHSRAESELYFQRPDIVHALSDEERQRRCFQNADLCVLDDKQYFVRGLLPLPVAGRTRPYRIGVWAEVAREVFDRIRELWTDPSQTSEPRMSACLANRLPLQPDTLGLRMEIQLTGPTTRPEFFLEAMEHPLYGEQTRGIDEHRALEYGDSTRAKPAV
jgi:hypothetical protein